MSSINDIRSSKFLKKEDVGAGSLVTIRSIGKQNVAMDGAEEDIKFILHFDEFEKPLVLNSTNAQVIAKISSADDDIENAWVGVKIVLYNDPNVSFGGKITGGIRVRSPKTKKETDLPF